MFRVGEEEAGGRLRMWGELQALGHPHLETIVDYGRVRWEGDHYVYVVTPRPNACLGDVLDEVTLGAEEKREIAGAVLSALAALHERGWTHRGVGPETVVAVGDRTVLRLESIGRRGMGDAAADMRALGRLLAALCGEDESLGQLAARCLGGMGATEGLRLLEAREGGQAEGVQRRLLWAATVVSLTVAVVAVWNGV